MFNLFVKIMQLIY